MSKLCKGKYHGSGIKEIADNEKYCEICKQEIKLNRKRTTEVATGVLGVVECELFSVNLVGCGKKD